jgi:hypothetical protein
MSQTSTAGRANQLKTFGLDSRARTAALMGDPPVFTTPIKKAPPDTASEMQVSIQSLIGGGYIEVYAIEVRFLIGSVRNILVLTGGDPDMATLDIDFNSGPYNPKNVTMPLPQMLSHVRDSAVYQCLFDQYTDDKGYPTILQIPKCYLRLGGRFDIKLKAVSFLADGTPIDMSDQVILFHTIQATGYREVEAYPTEIDPTTMTWVVLLTQSPKPLIGRDPNVWYYGMYWRLGWDLRLSTRTAMLLFPQIRAQLDEGTINKIWASPNPHETIYGVNEVKGLYTDKVAGNPPILTAADPKATTVVRLEGAKTSTGVIGIRRKKSKGKSAKNPKRKY